MVEVMTDKATVEIPSPRAGRIDKIHVPAGQLCKVGAVMVVIAEGGAAQKSAAATPRTAPAAPHTAPAATPHTAPAATPRTAIEERQLLDKLPGATNGRAHAAGNVIALQPASGRVLATPATRKLARDLGVDLASVAASGPHGRVTSDDVRAAGASATRPAGAARSPAASDTRIPFRGVRKKIAENMHRSRQTAAHFTYVEECDATELVALRQRAKARAEERGLKLSFLPFIVKAVCAGLKKYPIVNATLDEEKQEIVLRGRCHIGVAAATAEGLIVPVLKDADQRSLFDLARALEELSEKARTGKASRDEITGSTFTISSLGALGGLHATPIINFPEVAILGVHKLKAAPVVRDGQIVVREMMNLSISLDHRVVDGYQGAQFLRHVISLLEDPTLMFMEMV
jgi:pyruvate dehydrogenase E2 component (dihydrolipoamide acetyltransferase)